MDWIGGDADMLAMHNAAQPIGRMALPEEVAEAVVWLASDQASFVTGVALPIDGAMMAAAGGGK
jgi:NAD(P)-dependent dehydrogenase (short-subunit alcohol dehydrogenase family)